MNQNDINHSGVKQNDSYIGNNVSLVKKREYAEDKNNKGYMNSENKEQHQQQQLQYHQMRKMVENSNSNNNSKNNNNNNNGTIKQYNNYM